MEFYVKEMPKRCEDYELLVRLGRASFDVMCPLNRQAYSNGHEYTENGITSSYRGIHDFCSLKPIPKCKCEKGEKDD